MNVPSGAAGGFICADVVAAPGSYNPNDPNSVALEAVRLLTRLSAVLAPTQQFIKSDWAGQADGTTQTIDLVNGSFNGFVCNLSAGYIDVWFGGTQNTSHPDLTFGGSTTSYQLNLPILSQYQKIILVARGGPVGKLYVSQY